MQVSIMSFASSDTLPDQCIDEYSIIFIFQSFVYTLCAVLPALYIVSSGKCADIRQAAKTEQGLCNVSSFKF